VGDGSKSKLVHYVDSERVAVSRQFLRKTSDNGEANRKAQLLVTDPETFAEYRLDTEGAKPTTEEVHQWITQP
jgi:hypothetical protein